MKLEKKNIQNRLKLAKDWQVWIFSCQSFREFLPSLLSKCCCFNERVIDPKISFSILSILSYLVLPRSNTVQITPGTTLILNLPIGRNLQDDSHFRQIFFFRLSPW